MGIFYRLLEGDLLELTMESIGRLVNSKYNMNNFPLGLTVLFHFKNVPSIRAYIFLLFLTL